MSQRVLVTGHQGYLGTVMVPMLIAAGHDVVGLDNGYFADCVLGPAPADPPSLNVDLRDVFVEQLRGFDAVVHLAALSDDSLGALAPEITFGINYHASVRLARLAKAAGVSRFLYASTCSVYGAAGDGLVDENAALHPITPYAVSKVRVEDDVAAMADSGFAPVFLRNATAFGFSPRLRTDIVLNNLVGHAVLSGVVRVLSGGTRWRPLVHAKDIARAFAVCIEAPARSISCRAFNIGTEANNLTVAEIAAAVCDTVAGSELLIGRGERRRSAVVPGRLQPSQVRTGLRGVLVGGRRCSRAPCRLHVVRLDPRGLRHEVHPPAAPGGAAGPRSHRRDDASCQRSRVTSWAQPAPAVMPSRTRAVHVDDRI